MSACGNPKCSCSTGIHEGLTFGSGKLDSLGFWEFPCRICAADWDANVPDVIQKIINDSKFSSLDDAQKYIREAEWIQLAAWPYEVKHDKT